MMRPMDDPLALLQRAINERQGELQKVAGILARAAHSTRLFASSAKALLIVLGAFSATKATADVLFGSTSAVTLVVYTMAGLLTAAVAGLEAAFKFETRAAELTVLAAECHSTLRQVDTRWQREIGVTPDVEKKVEAAQALLSLQDSGLEKVQTQAARLGVNLALEVRALSTEEPYAA